MEDDRYDVGEINFAIKKPLPRLGINDPGVPPGIEGKLCKYMQSQSPLEFNNLADVYRFKKSIVLAGNPAEPVYERDFRFFNFSGINFRNFYFKKCVFPNAKFDVTDCKNAHMLECDLYGSSLITSRWNKCSITSSFMTWNLCMDTIFIDTDFSRTEIRGIKLTKTQIARCILTKAKLVGVDLTEAQIFETDFSDSELIYPKLQETVFEGSVFNRTLLLSCEPIRTAFRSCTRNEVEVSHSYTFVSDLELREIFADNIKYKEKGGSL